MGSFCVSSKWISLNNILLGGLLLTTEGIVVKFVVDINRIEGNLHRKGRH